MKLDRRTGHCSTDTRENTVITWHGTISLHFLSITNPLIIYHFQCHFGSFKVPPFFEYHLLHVGYWLWFHISVFFSYLLKCCFYVYLWSTNFDNLSLSLFRSTYLSIRTGWLLGSNTYFVFCSVCVLQKIRRAGTFCKYSNRENTPKRYQGLMERTNHSERQISFIRGDNLLFTTSRGRESRDDPDMVLYSLLLNLEKYSDQNQIWNAKCKFSRCKCLCYVLKWIPTSMKNLKFYCCS